MGEKYSRRNILIGTTGLAAVSGCLDRLPGSGGNETEEGEEPVLTDADRDILQRAENAQNELLEDNIITEYEEDDMAILDSQSARVEANVIRDVGIADAKEYRISAEVDLDHGAEDLEGFVNVDRETLMRKLSEPAYEMTTTVFENLERYDTENRNVHQSRVEEYQTVFHGEGDRRVRNRRTSEQLRSLETQDEYLDNFQENARYWDGEDWS